MAWEGRAGVCRQTDLDLAGDRSRRKVTHVQAFLHPHTTVHKSVLSTRVYYSSGPSGVGPSVAVVATHLSQECKTQAETVSGSG
jgi:hypothetical protein